MEGDGKNPEIQVSDLGSTHSEPERVSLVGLVPMNQPDRIASIEKPPGGDKHPSSKPELYMSPEDYMQKSLALSFGKRLDSAKVVRETDINKIADTIKPGDILRVEAEGKMKYFSVYTENGEKMVKTGGPTERLIDMLKDNRGAHIIRAPRPPATDLA